MEIIIHEGLTFPIQILHMDEITHFSVTSSLVPYLSNMVRCSHHGLGIRTTELTPHEGDKTIKNKF